MGFVVSFYDVRAVARFDREPWRRVQFLEGSDRDGTWTQIDDQPLYPLDDPAEPMSRNLTTANATAPGLWHRLVWVDRVGNTAQTEPLVDAVGGLVPDPAEVALLLRSRLRDDHGK